MSQTSITAALGTASTVAIDISVIEAGMTKDICSGLVHPYGGRDSHLGTQSHRSKCKWQQHP